MGTQTAIINHIQAKKADYVVALKANHPTLYTQVKNWFEQAQAHQFDGIQFSYDYRRSKGHHRLEKRWCWAVPLEAFGGLYQQAQWLGLQKDFKVLSWLNEFVIFGIKPLVKSNFISVLSPLMLKK